MTTGLNNFKYSDFKHDYNTYIDHKLASKILSISEKEPLVDYLEKGLMAIDSKGRW